MSRTFKSVDALHNHLKNSIVSAIENRLAQACVKVVQDNIQKRVYDVYEPEGDHSYSRTFELLNCVTVDNIVLGNSHATFDVFMDTSKISGYIRKGSFGSNEWNAHADVWDIEVAEYIPMWIEYGTEGSLWDREGAYYMEESHYELESKLFRELANELRKDGWDVTVI